VNPLVNRKTMELALKLQGINNEFADWKDRTKQGNPFEKHNSQVRRLTRQLGRAHAKLVAQVADPAFDVLDEARATEMDVLALHRIWDFFRSKLSQRHSENLRQFLAAADDLAWACYAPLCNAMADAAPDWRHRVKEPPLSFLNGGSSPFIQVRNRAFQVEDTLEEGLDEEKFGRLVQKLPISVIGIPWYELSHLPEILIVGHEVGHAVEFDLRLTEELDQALKAAKLPAAQLPAWQAWCSEAFADVFGALACGPAFAGTLLDFVAEPKSSIATESQSGPIWRTYPTVALRVKLVLATLRIADHHGEADAREREWADVYGSAHNMSEFDKGIDRVAEAFALTKFAGLGGATLDSLVRFDVEMHERAEEAAKQLLIPGDLETSDPREVLAGVRLAFERNPDAFREPDSDAKPADPAPKQITKRALAHLSATREKGVRASRASDPASEAEQGASDDTAGDAWFDSLHRLRRPKDSGDETPGDA
jgi:hypothetical protein